mgnify:CR=1 FL=1
MQMSGGADILLAAEEESELAATIATQLSNFDGDIYAPPAAKGQSAGDSQEDVMRRE